MTSNEPTPADRIRARPDYFGYDLGPAVADLLDEFARHDSMSDSHPYADCWEALSERVAALEDTIRRTFPAPAEAPAQLRAALAAGQAGQTPPDMVR